MLLPLPGGGWEGVYRENDKYSIAENPERKNLYPLFSLLTLTQYPNKHPQLSATISDSSNDRLGIQYFCTNSIIVPYAMPLMRMIRNHFFCCVFSRVLDKKGQANKKQRMPNMPVCIHLSACITASHGYFGRVEPGRHNNTRLTINQPIAGTKRISFKRNDLAGKIRQLANFTCYIHLR